MCVCVLYEHIWSLDSVALWAGSYLQAASGPETDHVDIGGTCIPASVSTVHQISRSHILDMFILH